MGFEVMTYRFVVNAFAHCYVDRLQFWKGKNF